jgi:hypothetical protein
VAVVVLTIAIGLLLPTALFLLVFLGFEPLEPVLAVLMGSPASGIVLFVVSGALAIAIVEGWRRSSGNRPTAR